jgi:lipoate---protein ligase
MKLLDLTLGTPAANLACDEALLDWCESRRGGPVLRFWEWPEYFVVLGYGNKVASEVDIEACRRRGIPILRRCSGGGAVVQGRGCLNYSLVLPIGEQFQSITETNCQVMQRNRNALRSLVKREVDIRGHTDLAMNDVKFSGNSQRRRREYLLFHGSFLLNFELALISEVLKFPSKQPEYRRNRSHSDFLANLGLPAADVKLALRREWQATTELGFILKHEIDALIQTRYSRDAWNFKS